MKAYMLTKIKSVFMKEAMNWDIFAKALPFPRH